MEIWRVFPWFNEVFKCPFMRGFILSLLILTPPFSPLPDKYTGMYGLGGQTYVYHHDEDESSFQLVDTARIQKPQHQKSRARYNQVRTVLRTGPLYRVSNKCTPDLIPRTEVHLTLITRSFPLPIYDELCCDFWSGLRHEDFKLSLTGITITWTMELWILLADDHICNVCHILTSLCSKRFGETGSEGRRGGWVANSSRLRGVRERGKHNTVWL